MPVTYKKVADSRGATLLECVASINSELQNFKGLEGLQEVTSSTNKSLCKGRILPCKMVFVK
eukprot:12909026-Prorocentrum_lima.AAC.1